jgi:glycerophosphoryl diester phosphodiesterase
MWNGLSRPTVIAHRGDKAYAPENTLASFNQAAEKGADAIEFDVKLTSDGKAVILHDQTVDRTTNGRGDISRLSLAEARKLDASIQFPGRFPGEKIPTLEEVFESVGRKLYMNVELTNYSTPGDSLVPIVVELVKKHGLQGRVLFSSFLVRNLRKAATLLPEVPRGLLTLSGLLGLWGRNFGWRGDYYALHPFLRDAKPGLVDRVHAAGKRVNVWTVNTEDDLKHMVGLGVDGIITDDPALALNVLGRSG